MKLDLFLFAFALFLAFLSGNMAYSIKSKGTPSFTDLEDIRKLHSDLQEGVQPHKRLDLNIEYPTLEHLKLLEEETPLTHQPRNNLLNSSECLKSKITQISSSFINKETLWVAYLCNQVDSLPSSFFSSPPFIYKNGMSYSYMKLTSITSHSRKIRWLKSHAKFMHISELKGIQWTTSPHQNFLIHQSSLTIKKILRGDNIFLSKKDYFIKTGNLKYYIISKINAKRFFKRTMYSFSEDSQKCFFRTKNICWKKKNHSLQNLFSQTSIALFFGTLIILLLTARSLFKRLRRKKKENEHKKHALRLLTHELRTPITSLLLHIDQISQQATQLPPDIQEHFLKIEGQVYRLKHLAEKSQSYLQTNDTGFITLQSTKIDSLNQFCLECILEYDKDKNIELTTQADTSIELDPYWLKICLMNLIDNAIRYGQAPIEISTKKTNESISISVRDQGFIKYSNIKELLRSKHYKSKGLGLGLLIVKRTLKEMGGKLSLTSNPTIFTINFTQNIKAQRGASHD